MTLLYIETTTTICSVALSYQGEIIFEIEDKSGMNHAKMLSPFVEKALAKLKEQNLTLHAIAVSSGPGSYTGLRIGISTAKGLCYGLNIPLIAVPTLEILVNSATQLLTLESNAQLFPMIDARRMEVYTAKYSPSLQLIEDVRAEIITEESFTANLQQGACYFFGNGAEKCKDVLTHPNAFFPKGIELYARHMISIAADRYKKQIFEDIAYFEPFYLKEFMATVPKKLF